MSSKFISILLLPPTSPNGDTFNVLKLRCFIAVVQGSYLKKLGAYFFRLKITEYRGGKLRRSQIIVKLLFSRAGGGGGGRD